LTDGIPHEKLTLTNDDIKLMDYWEDALINGVSNGTGPIAVFELFDAIISLFPLAKINVPIKLYHRTQPTEDDSVSVTKCSSRSTSPETLLSAAAASPSSSPSQKRCRSESCSSYVSGGSDNSIELRTRTVPPSATRHQSYDMDVSCTDTKGISKFLAIVEIHSNTDNFHSDAKNKFLCEIISKLQMNLR
jgi:hypothetical protein